MTLRETIINFLQGKKNCVATLQEIYQGIDKSGYISKSDTVHDSARAIIYRHEDTFKRVCKGVYMLNGEKSTSLLINGDGRSMSEVEDCSIDCIITDHPWEDKKAHRSGNQKHFAEYSTFRYGIEDFKAKARVLKEGAYLVEFLPVESATNYEYLFEIKQTAKQCGLNYYTHCIWRNAPEGTINTGKTTKGVQQILIFSKGKPRKLSRDGVNAYQSKEILKYEIEMLLSSKNKHHQAEKPIELYEYLINNLTDEHDVCLDQFGGSCNMLKAAVNTNRFAIVYELAKDFVKRAANRFCLKQLYDSEGPENAADNIFRIASSGQLEFVC
jgi:site-specific DNA-methyltransferase (adenine-specific)